MSKETAHKMGGDLTAVCGTPSHVLVIAWANVTCEACKRILTESLNNG